MHSTLLASAHDLTPADNTSSPDRHPAAPGPLPRLLIAACALAAVAVTAYLTIHALQSSSIAGCAAGSSCDQVLRNSASRWLGVPVAGLALLSYLAVLALLVAPARRFAHIVWALILALGLTAIAAAIWFTGLQLFSLHAICPWCMAAHLLGLLTGTLILAAVLSHPNLRRPRVLIAAAVLAAVGLTLLIGGQQLMPSATYAVLATSPTPAPAPADPILAGAQRTAASNALPQLNLGPNDPLATLFAPTKITAGYDTGIGPDRRLRIPDAAEPIDPRRMPILGSPDAKHLLILFFDYTCNHCRQLHHQLERAMTRYGDQIGIVLINFPLNSECNPHVGSIANDEYRYSCAYARLAAAIWIAAPDKFATFDAWAMQGVRPRPVDIAAQYAIDLVGQENLSRTLAAGDVEDMISRNITLGSDLPQKSLPLLLMDGSYMVGAPERSIELYQTLENKLGIQPLPEAATQPSDR
ncbi:MAG: thioredoxin domain-containing protein [Phycisphaeraceae bacterium]|nr:thioredoxin domain-containing protein [Phycisphaeraceae bacterium]